MRSNLWRAGRFAACDPAAVLTGSAPRERPLLRRPSGRAVALLAALAVGAAGAVAATRSAAGNGLPPGVGRPAPALHGTSLAGTPLDLAGLRGSVVVVDAWAAWCAPCRAELPVLGDAQRRLGPRGLRVLGIDVRDGAVQARALLAAAGVDPAASVADPSGALAAAWDVRDLPQTVVVDRAGTVRARHLGPVPAGWLDRVVTPLLAEPAA
jgi:cytochrome c biogenesis protein CcmG, thiol:disulfide interchange protein DsbE